MRELQIIILLLAVISSPSIGQEVGIDFRKIDRLEKAVAEASLESKYIFAYLHYEGCVYCPKMEKEVFSTREVGSFYNDRFISLTLDIDKDTLGSYFKSKYSLAAYPAYIYLDSKGVLRHKSAGYRNTKEFIEVAETALSESANFAYYKQKVSDGDLNSTTLRKYFSFGYVPEKDSLINVYLETRTREQLYSRETWLLLIENTPYTTSTYFDYILANENEFRNAVSGKEVDQYLIDRWVFWVNPWSPWWLNDIQRNKRKKKLRKTEHPLNERVIHQVDMELWIARAKWRKGSKSKLKKLIKHAQRYYAYGYDDWDNYYQAAWIILENAEKVSPSELDFGYLLAESSVDIHKSFYNLYIYAHYCLQRGEKDRAIRMLTDCLEYANISVEPKHIESAGETLREWKNNL